MTRDDIICMAREAGIDYSFGAEIERFAALVAAAEREACALMVERGVGDWRLGKKVATAIRSRGEK